jgi:hypothetical protein
MRMYMHEWNPVTDITEPLPGDYLRYYDDWGNVKNSGVIIKVFVHEKKPLTESYYLLKNMTTQRSWKVYSDRYKMEFMRHRTRNSRFGDYLRSLVPPNSDS